MIAGRTRDSGLLVVSTGLGSAEIFTIFPFWIGHVSPASRFYSDADSFVFGDIPEEEHGSGLLLDRSVIPFPVDRKRPVRDDPDLILLKIEIMIKTGRPWP
jgi:hypothetical protein